VSALLAILRDAWRAVSADKAGVVLISAILALVLWGPKGDPLFARWLHPLLAGAIADAELRAQLISFGAAVLLLVIVPLLVIRLRLHERPRDHGLGAGDVRLGLAFAAVLFAVSLIPFLLATCDAGMRGEYPLLFRGLAVDEMRRRFDWPTFVAYEVAYASFFFAIEFIFRGYLLFGLRERFGDLAILVQMLPYTAWHLPKPTVELIGTPLWGFAVAAVTLRVGSMWYVFAVHWLLNVVLDVALLVRQGVIGGG